MKKIYNAFWAAPGCFLSLMALMVVVFNCLHWPGWRLAITYANCVSIGCIFSTTRDLIRYHRKYRNYKREFQQLDFWLEEVRKEQEAYNKAEAIFDTGAMSLAEQRFNLAIRRFNAEECRIKKQYIDKQ